MRACLMVGLVAVGLAVAAPKKGELAAGLDGTWAVEKATLQGADATDTLGSAVLTIEGKSYTVDFAGQVDKGVLKLDDTQKPKHMDIEGVEGVNKGTKFPAIFELNKDTLTICYSLDGTSRPKAMESAKDSQTLLVVYKRKKK